MKTFVYFIHTHIDNTTEFNVNIESYIPFWIRIQKQRERDERENSDRERERDTNWIRLFDERRIDSNN